MGILNKYVKLNSKKAVWEEVDENTYAAVFSDLRYNVTYSLTESYSKLAFDAKQVPSKERKMKWTQVVAKDVVVTADKATVSVEAGKTELVTLTAKKGTAVVDGVSYTATSSDNAIATAAVEGNVVTITAVKAGTANITVKGSKTGETVKDATIAVTVTAPQQLVVESAVAVNTKQVKVTFNAEIGAVLANNFSLYEKGNEYAIKVIDKVAVSEKAAVITLLDALEANKEYVVKCTAVPAKEENVLPLEAGEAEFKYLEQQPASIAFTKTVYATGEELAYVIKDEAGNDITANFAKGDLTLESSDSTVVDTATFVASNSNDSPAYAVVNLKIKDTEIQTGNVIITVKKTLEELAAIGRWTLDNVSNPNFDKPVTSLFLSDTGYKLKAEALNQDGKELTTDVATTFTYRSTTPTVAVIDEVTGDVTPVSVGNATFVITAKAGSKQVSKAVTVQVKADPVATALRLDKTSVTLVKLSDIPAKVKVELLDQYGSVMESVDASLSAEINKTDVIGANDLTGISLTDGVAEITLNPGAGDPTTAVVTVTYEEGTTKLTKTFNVALVEKAAFAGYAAVVETTKLDKNGDDEDRAQGPKEVTVAVYEKDINGNYIKEVTTFTVSDEFTSDGAVSVSDKTVTAANKGTEKVYVKVNDLTIATFTFTVVDSTPALTTVTQLKNAISVKTTDELDKVLFGTDVNGGIFVGYDQYGDKIAITSGDYQVYSSNQNIVKNDLDFGSSTGTVTLTIKLANKFYTVTVKVE
ncbi:hypothetical protein [Desulforamulus hydrothermalis]|uniref:BIG2 domain-containing protein n=1 Tax=Desulforamulus hydrothermalis Lam5 = DSM 18033 TaxID=1121428 RepID=K8EIL6_9FIRM|nr:hypothetical protein [Desulforamulus hydrothermalis]CCO08446.1 hypothetical protein DESHY_30136 [Desulforamulus hydrothermalis Lam5 = DSM 18033]SHH15595.1 hypothetical protein SAMN02745177_01661 [Desulforamulus hydrothermalis Lam5 = DSM 18033]